VNCANEDCQSGKTAYPEDNIRYCRICVTGDPEADKLTSEDRTQEGLCAVDGCPNDRITDTHRTFGCEQCQTHCVHTNHWRVHRNCPTCSFPHEN
jgi:hypothetical protein